MDKTSLPSLVDEAAAGGVSMLTHAEIWSAIDRIAAANGITVSALARRSGLDPTSFNKSKRSTRDGKPRWPSTESISKVLTATGCTFSRFVDFVAGDPARPRRPIPLLGYAQAGRDGYFDEAGYPTGVGWEEIEPPAFADDNLFALRIVGDSMAPLYREGEVIVVSPAAPLRRGDRVVLRTRLGEVMAKELRRRSTNEIELASLNPAHPGVTLPRRDVAWMSRIVWASQ
jgi:phage repressor protein C with HTH and peptisase S24 domain